MYNRIIVFFRTLWQNYGVRSIEGFWGICSDIVLSFQLKGNADHKNEIDCNLSLLSTTIVYHCFYLSAVTASVSVIQEKESISRVLHDCMLYIQTTYGV